MTTMCRTSGTTGKSKNFLRCNVFPMQLWQTAHSFWHAKPLLLRQTEGVFFMEISHAWQEYLPDIEIRKYTPKPSAVTVTTRILSAEKHPLPHGSGCFVSLCQLGHSILAIDVVNDIPNILVGLGLRIVAIPVLIGNIADTSGHGTAVECQFPSVQIL